MVLRVRAARMRAGIARQSRAKEDPGIFTVAGAEGSQETETDRRVEREGDDLRNQKMLSLLA